MYLKLWLPRIKIYVHLMITTVCGYVRFCISVADYLTPTCYLYTCAVEDNKKLPFSLLYIHVYKCSVQDKNGTLVNTL